MTRSCIWPNSNVPPQRPSRLGAGPLKAFFAPGLLSAAFLSEDLLHPATTRTTIRVIRRKIEFMQGYVGYAVIGPKSRGNLLAPAKIHNDFQFNQFHFL